MFRNRPIKLLSAVVLLGFALPSFGQVLATTAGAGSADLPVAADLAGASRLALFEFNGNGSTMTFSLFAGSFSTTLDGEIVLSFGDATLPVPCNTCVAVSVRRAVLLGTEWTPSGNILADPMVLMRDPSHISGGWYNPVNGRIRFTLYLIDSCGGPPAPMPLYLSGTMSNGRLIVSGCNSDVVDAEMCVSINGQRAHRRPDLRFSTEIDFPVADTSSTPTWVGDGDLLSESICVLRSNHQLTARLGVMPPVPDLGLDAVTLTTYRPIFFSLEQTVWSETMGRWLGHGDLLSIIGHVVRTNAQLTAAFGPLTGVANDLGLDAVHVSTELYPSTSVACCDCILFSTEVRFYSTALNRWIGHGDLLCSAGCVLRTNRQLLSQFHPIAVPACVADEDCSAFGPCGSNETPALADLVSYCTPDDTDEACVDLGLDGVFITPRGEVWFSLEHGFYDANLGWISDGDVLSERGYVVRRNLDLVDVCNPLIDCANFGLDALDYAWPIVPTPAVSVTADDAAAIPALDTP